MERKKVPFFSNEDGTPVKWWQVPLGILCMLWGLAILFGLWFVFLRTIGFIIGI